MIETLNSHRLWFDISVPRDIGLDSMENITVVTVDDLKDIVQSNIGQRADEAKIAYTIVGHWTIEFFKWINTLSVDPLIKSLREKAYQSSEMEISKAIKKGVFSKEQEEMLKMLMHSTFKKFLHEPTVNLKGLSSSPKLESVAEAIKYLFELGDEANVLDSYKLNEKAVNEIF
jgi:glutamyl-tRNA reductase